MIIKLRRQLIDECSTREIYIGSTFKRKRKKLELFALPVSYMVQDFFAFFSLEAERMRLFNLQKSILQYFYKLHALKCQI